MRLTQAINALCVLGATIFALAQPAQGASNMSYGITVGTVMPKDAVPVRVGRVTFLVYHGSFYRQVKNGYVLVPAPQGATFRGLPRGAEKFQIGKTTYYRHAGTFFKATGSKFQVCDEPATSPVAANAPAEAEASSINVRLGEDEYLFRNGRFFRRTEDGLIGRSAPIGAVAQGFPPDAMSVWYGDGEYFESYGVFFQETADGFKVIVPPWQKPLLPVEDATTLAAEH